MPWQNPKCTGFTGLEIVAAVPATSGVYGLIEGDTYLFVGESWNLQARLLDLASVLGPQLGSVSVIYETCPESDRCYRKQALSREFLRSRSTAPLAASSG